MQLIAFDYVRDKANQSGCLAKLAELIRKARVGSDLCLLLDNGDTFQGTPMGDVIAKSAPQTGNPMAEAMSLLGYDAFGLGNHDFDLGLDYLARNAVACTAPVICSNLRTSSLPDLKPHAILDRMIKGSDGKDHPLKIGILSALPFQTEVWNRHVLGENATILCPVETLRDAAKQVRAEGADLVIVLAHMGLTPVEEVGDPKQELVAIAAIEGVDAIVAGHTHTRFPGPDHAGIPGVDVVTGRISGVPAVLPGHGGSDLGVIDLELNRRGAPGQWRVTKSSSALYPVSKKTRQNGRILQRAERLHQVTRAYLAEPVAQSMAPMNTYFALADPSPVPALMAAAKLHAIRIAVTGTAYEHLPLLAAASTPSTGGFDGPDNFVAFAGGQLRRRDVAGLNPFANQVWAIKTTGAQLIDWLERSAVLFNRLQPEKPDQFLVDPQVPGFRFDAIYGLTYQIDPTQPARFGRTGHPQVQARGRIGNVCWQGKPIDPEQAFLIATTDHRAGGGGAFRPIRSDLVVVKNSISLESALLEYLEQPDHSDFSTLRPWRFAPNLGVSAVLQTSPEALSHLDQIADLSPERCGDTEDGFALIRLRL